VRRYVTVGIRIDFRMLGMALFSRIHLLLSCKQPSLRPAGEEGDGFYDSVFMQTATRAAALDGGD